MSVSSIGGSSLLSNLLSSSQQSLLTANPTTASAVQSSSTSSQASSNDGAAVVAALAGASSIASSTGTNWLNEAQSAIQASESTGGMMGALQSESQDSQPGSISSFLQQSQDEANALASIMQNAVSNEGQLYSQIAQNEGEQAAADRAAQEAALIDPPDQTNFTPPMQLDPVEYYDNGAYALNTQTHIMTLPDGSQVDTTTGLPYVDPKSLVSLANGAYLNTATNIITESNGTQVNATTGITVSTTA